MLMSAAGIKSLLDDSNSSFDIEGSFSELEKALPKLEELIADIDTLLETTVTSNPAILGFSKWASYLPLKYQVALLKDRYFDLSGAARFFGNTRFVDNSGYS